MTLPFPFDGIQKSRGLLFVYCSLFLLAVVILLLLINSWRAGLSHVPGPFLARYTDAWTLYSAWRTLRRGDKVEYYNQLQARYGDVIRIGPKSVLVLDPAAVPVIYGVRAKLDKVINNIQPLWQNLPLMRPSRVQHISPSVKLA